MPEKNSDIFETLFQRMQAPRFLVRQVAPDRDPDRYIVAYANDLALRYFDLEKDQVIDQDLSKITDHENARHFQQSFEVCASKKRPVTIQALPGMPGPLRVYGFYITPLLDGCDNVEYLDVIGHLDVTDQSILQRERDDAISLLTSIFDVSEIGIVVTDHNRRIVRVNESFVRMYGWTRDDLINIDVTSLITPDERELAIKNHDDFIQSGGRSSGEMKIIRKDAGIANALFTTATLELSQKRRFQVTTVMDITLRKQMEISLRLAKEQADAANRAKSMFLANMSHELRTPLNAILGFSEMMIKETFGALGHPKYAEYIGDVHGSANHLLEIINEVLDMSKIEAGRIDLDEGECDMKELIASVLRMMESRFFGKDLHLKTDIAADLPHMIADQRLMRQVLINLVTNAVKFSDKDGEIRVFAKIIPENGEMEIIVADDGVGIPKDKIKQAMEPFAQVKDRAENASQQGTGLGLPLAKAMVELHGGRIDLQSDTGQGASVVIHLPASRVVQ
ncbi:MAG: PAS domain-containing sensor histidine kinase [Bdellovibrionales bacterium]